jgi:RHS repeat-associated protein
VPGYVDIKGVSIATNTVTVNGQTAYRKGEYFWALVKTNNSATPIYEPVTIASVGTNVTGNLLLPKTPQTFVYDADGNLVSDGLWTNTWDAENRLVATESSAGVPPAIRMKEEWSYLPDGRWNQRIVSSWNGSSYAPQYTNRFVWDGKVLLAILDQTNGLVMSFMRGLDLSGSQQGAGGVGGLLAVGFKTNGTHFVAFDGNGNVAALVGAADGTATANYEYGAFGEPIRITGSVGKLNPIRFSTQFSDDVTGDLKYLYRIYGPSTGGWKSRDPEEEDGGDNLYVFVGNEATDIYDLFGLRWMVGRNGDEKAGADPDAGDTITDLANLIGLDASEYEKWLTVPQGNTMPSSASQKMTGCEHFEVPNTVVAYWAGNLGWFGRWYVRWNSSVKYLGSLGFKVENHHHQKGDAWGLTKMFIPRSMGKELHGVYFWGHGSAPYPSDGLYSDTDDLVLEFASPGLYYHMGLGLVFACDSNTGQSALMSGNGIWKGFPGTLVPWPYPRYHARHYIHHGQQETH